MTADSPLTVARHRSCPVRLGGSSKTSARPLPARECATAAGLVSFESLDKKSGLSGNPKSRKFLCNTNRLHHDKAASSRRDEEETTRKNVTCNRTPIALGKYRSCPGRPDANSHISRYSQVSESAGGLEENGASANTPIALGRHRSCPQNPNGSTHIPRMPQFSSSNGAGLIFFGAVQNRYGLNEIPEQRPLFYGLGDEDSRVQKDTMSREKRTDPGGEAMNEEEGEAFIDIIDTASEWTENTKSQDIIISVKNHGINSSLTTDCNPYNSTIFSNASSMISNGSEEICVEKEEESLKKRGIELLQMPSHSRGEGCYAVRSSGDEGSFGLDSNPSHSCKSVDSIVIMENSEGSLVFNTSAGKLSSEHDDRRSVITLENPLTSSPLQDNTGIQRNVSIGVGEEEESTTKLRNANQNLSEKQLSLQLDPGNAKTLKPERAEPRIFYDTIPDTDVETWETTESCNSYNLDHLFKSFARCFSNKVKLRSEKRESSEDEHSMDKLIFV